MIRELKRDIEKHTREIAQLTKALRAIEALEAAHPETLDATERQGKLKASATVPSYPEATHAVLKKAPRGQTVREILNALSKAGRPIETSKPYRTIYKVLRGRSDLFEKSNGKWRAREESQQ